jgi:hypothetical protein
MIQRLKKLNQLPYKTYVSALLKDESYLDRADESGIEGYSMITKSPKMVMLFVEYEEGKYAEINKKIWDMIKLEYKSISEGKNGAKTRKNRKVRHEGTLEKSKKAEKLTSIS